MDRINNIFEKALSFEDNKAIDYIFEQLGEEYEDDEIVEMWTDYLCDKFSKLKKMQVGSGISSTLGWAKRKGYSVVVENPYK